MIIRHSRHERNFVQIHKTALNDPKLSFKAKGILAYLMSKPDVWTVRIKDLCNNSHDGPESIRNGLKELQKHGYAELVRGGKDGGTYWNVFETPDLAKKPEMAETATSGGVDVAETRNSGNPKFGKPENGVFATLSNNDSLVIMSDSKNEKEGMSKERKRSSTAPPSKPPKTTDPRIHEFISGWFDRYQKKFGRKYIVAGGKDGKLVKQLLASSGMTVSDLLVLAQKAWDLDVKKHRWLQEQSMSISGFKSRINELLEKVNPVEICPMGPKDRWDDSPPTGPKDRWD